MRGMREREGEGAGKNAIYDIYVGVGLYLM
jgi:hypothetical protein